MAAARPEIGLNASLVPKCLIEGGVAIAIQSGSLAASFLELGNGQACLLTELRDSDRPSPPLLDDTAAVEDGCDRWILRP